MFSFDKGYAQGSESAYLEVVDRHVSPALNLMVNEYFNVVDESFKKDAAETIALILKRQSDHQQSMGVSVSGVTEEGKSSLVTEILDKCHQEIEESPESITAFFACDLVSVILTKTGKPL